MITFYFICLSIDDEVRVITMDFILIFIFITKPFPHKRFAHRFSI